MLLNCNLINNVNYILQIFRIPQADELKFLPYNIHYQIDDKETSEDDNTNSDTDTETPHFDKVLKTTTKIQHKTKPKSAESTNKESALNYISPDEGVYSSSSDSGSGTGNIVESKFYDNLQNNLIDKSNCHDDDFILNTGTLVQQKRISRNFDKLNGNCRRTIIGSRYSINSLPSTYLIKQNFLKSNNFCGKYTNELNKPTKNIGTVWNVTKTEFPTVKCNKSTDVLSVLSLDATNDVNNIVNKNSVELTSLLNNDIMLASTSTLTQSQPTNFFTPLFHRKYNTMSTSLIQPFSSYNDLNAKSFRSLSVEPSATLRINLNNKNNFHNKDQNFYRNKINSTNDVRSSDVITNYDNNVNPVHLKNLFQYLKKEIVCFLFN